MSGRHNRSITHYEFDKEKGPTDFKICRAFLFTGARRETRTLKGQFPTASETATFTNFAIRAAPTHKYVLLTSRKNRILIGKARNLFVFFYRYPFTCRDAMHCVSTLFRGSYASLGISTSRTRPSSIPNQKSSIKISSPHHQIVRSVFQR